MLIGVCVGVYVTYSAGYGASVETAYPYSVAGSTALAGWLGLCAGGAIALAGMVLSIVYVTRVTPAYAKAQHQA